MITLHFGQLHPYEMWLALVLAFGPFLVLIVVVFIRRRQAIADEGTESASAATDADKGPNVIRTDP